MDKTNLSTYFKKQYIRPLGNVPPSIRSQSYTDLLQLRPSEKTRAILSFASFAFGLLTVCALSTASSKCSKKHQLWHYQAKVAKRAGQATPGVFDSFTSLASFACFASCRAKARLEAKEIAKRNKAKALLHFAVLTTFACCPSSLPTFACAYYATATPALQGLQSRSSKQAQQLRSKTAQQIANRKQMHQKQAKVVQSSAIAKQQLISALQTHFPFFNRSFDKKRLKLLLSWYYANKGEAAALAMVETLQKVGFSYAMKAGISLGVDDLKVPAAKVQFLEQAVEALNTTKAAVYNGSVTAIEEFQQFIDTWHRTSESLKQSVVQNFTIGFLQNKNSSSAAASFSYSAITSKQVQQQAKQEKNSAILEKNHLKEKNYKSYGDTLNPVYMMAFSGARGNLSQVRQLVGMRGLMADPQGQLVEFPIQSNFREGLTVTEYMISCYGARKGLVDTALRTAAAGYLTRRLVDVSHHQVVRSVTCSTKDGIFCKGTTSALQKGKDKPEGTRNTVLPPAWKIPSKQQKAANATCPLLAMPAESVCLPFAEHGPAKEAVAGQAEQKASEGGPVLTLQRQQAEGNAEGNAGGNGKQGKKEQSKKHQEVKAISSLVSCVGRVLARDIPGVAFRNQEIDISLSSAPLLREVYENFGIYVRSPLTCKASVGICQLCYGWGVSANQLVGIGEAVGVIAAQSIGEPGTQLTMRTFHTGGVFSGDIMEECRAKHPGKVSFHGAYLGLLVRTEGGRIAFCIKTPGILQVIGFQQEIRTSYSIAANTLLFVRQGEEVSTDSLLAQIPNLPTLEQKPGESTKTISSALSGEIRETRTISEKLGNIRILSGQKEPSILRMLPGSHRLGTCFLLKLPKLQNKDEVKSKSNIASIKNNLKTSNVTTLPLASKVKAGKEKGLENQGLLSLASTLACCTEQATAVLTVRSKKSKQEVAQHKQLHSKKETTRLKTFLLYNSTALLLDLRYFITTTVITKTTLYKNQSTNYFWSQIHSLKSNQQNRSNKIAKFSYNNQNACNQVNHYVFQLVAQPLIIEGKKNIQLPQPEGRLGLKKSFSLINCAHLFWQNSLLIRLRCDIWMQKGFSVSTFKYRLNENWCSTCFACSAPQAMQSRQNKTYKASRQNSNFVNSLTKNSEIKRNPKFATVQFYPLLQSDSKHTKQKFLRYNKQFSNLSLKIFSRFQKTPDINNTTNSDATKNTQDIGISSLNSVAGELFPIQSTISDPSPLALPTSLDSSLACSASAVQHLQSKQYLLSTCLPNKAKQVKETKGSCACVACFAMQAKQVVKSEQRKKQLSALLPASDYLLCTNTARKKSVLTHYDRVSYNLVQKKEIISNNSVTSVAQQVEALCLPLASSLPTFACACDACLLLAVRSKHTASQATATPALQGKVTQQATQVGLLGALAVCEASSKQKAQQAKEAKGGCACVATCSAIATLAPLAPLAPHAEQAQQVVKSKVEIKGLMLNKQIGTFINQREEIVQDLGSSYCGQIIEKSSSQITLRLAQNILYSDYARRRAKVNKDLEKWVPKGTPVVTVPYSNSITGDIVAGIPKIEQLFEARGEALDKAVETLWANYEFTIRPTAKAVRECLKEIGLFVVQAIQKVYLSQGVHIADKHLEVIVRQMTRRVCITDPGDTSFLSEEFVDLQTIECVNWTTYGKRAAYRPRLIGITRASLNSNSFLSSASFQQTARVLERESFKEKTDRLLGLKERVMIGALIDAGTGGFRPEVRLNSLSNIYNFSSIGLKKKEKAQSLFS